MDRFSVNSGGAGRADLSGAAPGSGSALPFLLEDYAGQATWAGKPIFTPQEVIGQIDGGEMIKGKTITFTFIDNSHPVGHYNNPKKGHPEAEGYEPFSEAQREVAREAMVLWDDLIAVKIQENNGNGADIVFANTTTGPAQAWAYYPGNGPKHQGDVWIATPEANWTNDWLMYNGYGRTTLIHEAGHSLGLSHPGDYNFSDDNDGDGEPDPITYEDDAFYAQDTEQFSIMSYFSPQKSGAQPVEVSLALIGNAQTPLLHDIYVIQSKYGADPTTRAGNTTYGFNSNAGNEVYDFSQNLSPYLSIYDAGGVDTLDLSGANASVFLDLRPGAFSSAAVRPTLAQANALTEEFNAATDDVQGDFDLWGSQAELDAWLNQIGSIGQNRVLADTGVSGINALSHRNISIAYNTVIENAAGGSARDYLVGNHVGNVLNGGGGNDVLNGLGGDDTLIGGAGADEFRFIAVGGRDRVSDFATGADKVNVSEIDANLGVAGNQAFTVGASAGAGVVVLSTVSGVTTASFHVDGDGKADLVVSLVGGAVVGDFIL
jgi:serralysin